MYHLNHKVRYSEISADGYVDIAQVVNYLQDCSTFESFSVGDTIENQKAGRYAWMLAAWQVEVERFPKMYEDIVISSWHYGHKGILANRNFDICDVDGNRIVSANYNNGFNNNNNINQNNGYNANTMVQGGAPKKSFDVMFRGSKNQRILDVKKSLKAGKAVEVKKYQNKKEDAPEKKQEIYI